MPYNRGSLACVKSEVSAKISNRRYLFIFKIYSKIAQKNFIWIGIEVERGNAYPSYDCGSIVVKIFTWENDIT